MRLCIISDIHSNHLALESCIKDISNLNIDTIIFNGDILTDFPYPNKTMELIMSLKDKYNIILIKGNREEYILSDLKYNGTNGSLIYTKENLDKKYFIALKEASDYYEVSSDIIVCHAKIDNKNELYYYDSKNTIEYLNNTNYKYTIIGHSHKPFIKELNNKYLINTGPLGHLNKEYDGGSYLIFDTLNNEFEIKYAIYDKLKAKMEFVESNLYKIGGIYSECIMDMLDNNIPIASNVIKLGYELMGDNPYDEKYFIEAYRYYKYLI